MRAICSVLTKSREAPELTTVLATLYEVLIVQEDVFEFKTPMYNG